MLQVIPARRFLRILEVPLGLVMGAGGFGGVYFVLQIALHDHWAFAFLIPSSLGIGVLGVLLMIHAATNALAEWVVGTSRDNVAVSARPNEEL